MPLSLLLSIGNFVVGLAAFSVIGLVSPIGRAFEASPEEAGAVMTWYAIAYVASPIAAALTGSASRRLVLTGGLVLLAAGAALGALAPSLLALKASRILVALGAGLFTPGAAAVAVALSTPERRARELSVVFFGLTLAQVLGVPLGSWAGYAYGFQATFWVVAGLGLLAAAITWTVVPATLAFRPVSLATLGETLTTLHCLAAVLFTTTLVAAMYVVYTYLGPLIETRFGYGRDGVTAYLLIFGAAAVFGNFTGGFSADAIGPSRTLAIICLTQALMLPVVAMAPLSPLAMGVAVVVWSLSGWSFMTPQQARLVAIAPEKAPVMLSLNASAIYLGVALGSAVGGAALGRGGWTAVGLAALGTALLALAHLVWSDRLAARARAAAVSAGTGETA